MMKVNRIGNKLGLAGAVGVLLAIGMIANQMVTESTLREANALADLQQGITENSLVAHISLRQMQLAGRAVRLANTPDEVEINMAEMRQFKAVEEKQIDSALALALYPATKERLQNIKAQMADFAAGAEDLGKTQSALLLEVAKRTAISNEWEAAFEAEMKSPVLAELTDRQGAQLLLHRADSMLNSLRAAGWRFGATGEDSQKKIVGERAAALDDLLGRVRGLSNDKAFRQGIEALAGIVARFKASNDEAIRLTAAKAEIINGRTLKSVAKAADLIGEQVAIVQQNAKATKAKAVAETAVAYRINFILAIVVMGAIVGSVLFSFFGIARPLTRLNGALGEMAGGRLDIAIPGVDRGDEIGDLAKTVTVIRENAEQKARDETEAKIEQDQIAARQRKADMVRLADDFENAVGEIIETVSSASTELEASASTLTATAERAQELATMVAAASEEASANVQSVASATEELASSVHEISRQVQESARMANEAVDQARQTNDRVGELSKAAAASAMSSN